MLHARQDITLPRRAYGSFRDGCSIQKRVAESTPKRRRSSLSSRVFLPRTKFLFSTPFSVSFSIILILIAPLIKHYQDGQVQICTSILLLRFKRRWENSRLFLDRRLCPFDDSGPIASTRWWSTDECHLILISCPSCAFPIPQYLSCSISLMCCRVFFLIQ